MYLPARYHPEPVHLARAPLEDHHNEAKRTAKASPTQEGNRFFFKFGPLGCKPVRVIGIIQTL